MRYYELLASINELVGDTGLLRLPSHIFETYVFDDARRRVFERALSEIEGGRNVLIVGPPGTGKTALMAMILKALSDEGRRVGYILEGVEKLGNEHLSQGIVLFYDDIPRILPQAARSLVLGRVSGIIATARTEELDDLRIKLGVPIEEVFTVLEIGRMDDEHLLSMLDNYSVAEGVPVREKAKKLIVSKAGGLPVYIWQVVRDARIQGVGEIDEEFAGRIPQGMLDYVDDILWRILDEHENRYPVILLLLIVSDMPKYEINADLLLATFAECVAEFTGEKVSLDVAIEDELLTKVMKYMAKVGEFTYKFPHDSWGDVMKGRSRGLMSGEIARVNTLFPKAERVKIVSRAVERARKEIISFVRDEARVRAFEEFVARLELEVPQEEAGEELTLEGNVTIRAVKVVDAFKAVTLAQKTRKRDVLGLSPFAPYLLRSASLAAEVGMKVTRLESKTEVSKGYKHVKIGRVESDVWYIRYPSRSYFKVSERLIALGTRRIMKILEDATGFAMFVGAALLTIPMFTFLALATDEKFSHWLFLGILAFFVAFLTAVPVYWMAKRYWLKKSFVLDKGFRTKAYTLTLSELTISGDESSISNLLFELAYEGFQPVPDDERVRELGKRLGVDVDKIAEEWRRILKVIAP